jgi:NADH-quinone oxidoreductase subunit J
MIDDVLLGAFAVGALAGAALMLVLRHPMRVALALVATMLSLAGVYAMLGAHAIAVFQVLIYVGAVMVFMVYVIMLLDVRDTSHTGRYSWMLLPGVAGFLALLVVLGRDVWTGIPVRIVTGAPFGVQPFSVVFLNDYWVYFELVSLLLVAAVVGALAVIHVGRRGRG